MQIISAMFLKRDLGCHLRNNPYEGKRKREEKKRRI